MATVTSRNGASAAGSATSGPCGTTSARSLALGAITQAQAVAEKIRASLSEPYQLRIHPNGQGENQLEHHCTTSIGVALFAAHDASQDEILKRSDAAMYEAKQAGRNQVRLRASAYS